MIRLPATGWDFPDAPDDAQVCVCWFDGSDTIAKVCEGNRFVTMQDVRELATTAKAFAPAAESILEEAQRITGNGGARNDGYDHPRPNFTKIAAKWSVTLGVPVTAEQVALCMIDMKTVRENHKHQRDNLVDIAGYARCIERLEEREG